MLGQRQQLGYTIITHRCLIAIMRKKLRTYLAKKPNASLSDKPAKASSQVRKKLRTTAQLLAHFEESFPFKIT